MTRIATYALPFAALMLWLGFQVENYNSFFFITALIPGGLAAFILWTAHTKEVKQLDKSFSEWKSELQKNGLHFSVDLSQCKVINNNYKQDITSDSHETNQYKALDTAAGRDNRVFRNVQESVVVCEQEINGKRIKFYSETLEKDSVTLQFYLSDKKTTSLYVDPENHDNYYFDITFLY